MASVDGLEDSQWTQKQYPHLIVVADPDQKFISAVQVVHPKAGHKGQDVAAPTTFLIDKQGVVRWLFRPDSVMTRMSPKDLVATIDSTIKP